MVDLRQVIAPSFYDLHHDIKQEIHNEYWLKGGRGSTKSTFISVEILLGMIADPEANAVVFRRYQNELRETVYGQFEWSAIKLGIAGFFTFQVSPMQIIYNPTGQRIVFKGADNPRKMKSINLGKGYIKYAWFEEVDQFAGMEEIRNILQSLFRGGNEQRISFYSFNPPKSARSWVNQETKIVKLGRRVHHSDYLSVPREWLGEIFLTEAEHLKKVNENAYRHEYLGEEVGTGLEIFSNVTLRVITDAEIATFDVIRQGLDFGYAIDPVAFERLYFARRKIIFMDEFSGINISNKVLYDNIKRYTSHPSTADSAEPKSIDELRSYGMRIKGAKKGPDSIDFGIKFLQSMEEIIIDPARNPRAAKEFVNYAYDVDRNGEVKSKYPDYDNHTIDATRYALEDDMKHNNKVRVSSKAALGL